ncbi:zinc finger protein 800-like isoform X1 [Lucilia sericata]|uniref:zinc finger protein 800-like isoform X1 n=1 Tax=Lucilia sericata TaxID=13632 RepID=UPI0018A80CB6|nr:zinc finger protein 800-like isoform X1 [Lucilia sericata]XP_037827948.1 zinc finger protein 800-like isoform X1 [Lucilia sericata]XP_037827949.1 zinc finger protein 800-like isoform X1 [Lucilia sericata]
MVDTKCNFLNSKYKKSECNASNTDVTNEDESLLRQPLRTSCAGFWEAKKAYENGTDEVRRLLIQECSLIYECNMCRNMFRSLANFISHKRSYCKMTSQDNFHSFADRNSSVLIQTVERSEPWLVKSRSTGSSPIPSPKTSNRDLSTVIERLKRVEVSPECSKNNTLSMEHIMNPLSPEPKAPDPVLELERVSSTAHAVYQTLKMQNDSDSIKTELDEVHNLLSNQKTMLGPDGKVIISPTLITYTATSENDSNGLNELNYEVTTILGGISCEICNMTFQTEKTLKMHVQKKHTSSTYVFQCPTCSMTFLQPAAVIRHLANEHKKPMRRIRKMRDTILKKRIQIGDVQVKGPSREVKRLKMNNTEDNDVSNSLDQQNGKSVTSCLYCLKKFERRAALTTHLSNCSARKTSLNKTEMSKKLNTLDLQINEEKLQKEISNQILESNNQNDKTVSGEQTEAKVNIKQEPQENENSGVNATNINELFQNLENQTFGNGLRTVSLEKLEILVDAKGIDNTNPGECNNGSYQVLCSYGEQNNEKSVKRNKAINSGNGIKKEKTKRFRIISASKQLTCRCKICNKQFNALSNLRRHISMFHYRSRRFGCSLCDYRAFRRYDIVNHLTFVHKMTEERETMAVEYVTVHEIKYSKDDVEGDIVVVSDEATASEQNKIQEQGQVVVHENALRTYVKREKRKNVLLQPNKVLEHPNKVDSIVTKDVSHVKVIRRKMKKSLDQQVEGKKRPIRNRIKTVNKDFVYDLLTVKEEPKQSSRVAFKRRNTMFTDQNNTANVHLTPPSIKLTPYRLRTEPLIPLDKSAVKGVASNVCRNVIHEGLAASSTLPELPAERPQMRPRLISSSRNDSSTVPIIETTELEAARLKSTLFDDSFLEKFAKKSNPSFKMKPLLALQHSPLNSILQKFDATQQNILQRTDNNNFFKPPEKTNSTPPNFTLCSLQQTTLKEMDITPNGKQVMERSSPPATPKKRITLMQRLAENRAKRRDSVIRTALEN